MSILFQQGGSLTTIQDIGRIGYQDLGFSVSGAMDQRAYRLANLLLDNEPTAAMLEVTLIGPQLTFQTANCFVVTGAPMDATLNDTTIENNRVYAAKAGDQLTFPKKFPVAGARSYIAFAGGLDVPPLMGSRSTYLKGKMGGLEGRAIKALDKIAFLDPKESLPNLEKRFVEEEFTTVYGKKNVKIRVILGPQDDAFTQKGLDVFLSEPFVVTPQCDRMGVRLDGPCIEHIDTADIVSDGIAFGSIQVPSNGQPIILLADRQATGGYTKIATVISADLPKIAQRQIGHRLFFVPISVEEAQRELVETAAYYKQLKASFQTVKKRPSFFRRLFKHN